MAHPASRPRALVVEDDGSIRELLRFHLDLSGFLIEEAADGRLGLERARAQAFDVILLDVMLPSLDGVSLCRAVRAEGPNTATPILMLTHPHRSHSRRAVAQDVWIQVSHRGAGDAAVAHDDEDRLRRVRGRAAQQGADRKRGRRLCRVVSARRGRVSWH